jgi:hypothetical protein
MGLPAFLNIFCEIGGWEIWACEKSDDTLIATGFVAAGIDFTVAQNSHNIIY